MKEFIKYVGMDVHKETIAVPVAPSDAAEVRFVGEIVNSAQAIEKLVKSDGGLFTSLAFPTVMRLGSENERPFEMGENWTSRKRVLVTVGLRCSAATQNL